MAAPAEVCFALSDDEHSVTVTVHDGVFTPGGDAPAFVLRARPQDWRAFFSPHPEPPYQSWFGMRMRRDARVQGDELVFAQHVHLVRRFLDHGRHLLGATEPETRAAQPDRGGIRGGYVRITVDDLDCDIHYEQAGSGTDLLCLHTAGADGRQYHGLLGDPDFTARYRMTVFDLPGHGRSDPLPAQLDGRYSLTTDCYASVVLAVAEALALDQPVVCGCSMAGEICLELAWREPGRFSGVIACEAAEHVPGRRVSWARHPLVNQALFVPEWIYGLSSPTSPRHARDLIWWQYSQGGYATFAGDIDFYSGDWDARDRLGEIDTGRCPVVLMTGEYDYSCTPEMSRRTAERIPGAAFWPMPGLGHFPMAENPALFATYLSRALDHIGV
ncbi:alpha/beta fold hydrolase [Qaidamihabitans albus]|uniref:alpha/beta fold hydrolase n=1 Tax=Qaidamihabitans albus TaxID=2795733 RepID=UPI0018F2698A|nr:alpha/beta hydrolase [Qaidamihabitans albus]